MRHLLQHHCLPAIAHLRAGLVVSLLVLMALFPALTPDWSGGARPAATATLAAVVPGSGEETPTGESTGQETPAKLRRATALQEPRPASHRATPPRVATPAVGMAVAERSIMPAAPPAPPAALPMHWRLQRSQAPPLG